MKMRAPVKIAIAFGLIVAGSYGGYRGLAAWRASTIHLPGIKPGRVNLLVVQPGAGYRIIVANQVAQLVEGGAAFESNSMSGGENSDDPSRPKIPIREMLASLQGDISALSRLTMVLNGQREDQLPFVRRTWKAEDIELAFKGDAAKRTELESDLNVKLDGTPLPQVSVDAIENGIVVDAPVPINLRVADQPAKLEARVLQAFRPDLAESVSGSIEKAGPDVTPAAIKGYYAQAVQAQGDRKQNVQRSLERMLDRQMLLDRFAPKVEKVLNHASIVLNEQQVNGASFSVESGPNGKNLYTIHIKLSGEGRDRLLKASVDHRGAQLLLTVDGVAVAAPKMQHELWTTEIDINQLTNETLVKEAVDKLNELALGEKH